MGNNETHTNINHSLCEQEQKSKPKLLLKKYNGSELNKLKWKLVNSLTNKSLSNPAITSLIALYKQWLDTDYFLYMRHYKVLSPKEQLNPPIDAIFRNNFYYSLKEELIPASKRGNAVYSERVRKNLNRSLSLMPKEIHKNHKLFYSSYVFVTLTLHGQKENSLFDYWKSVLYYEKKISKFGNEYKKPVYNKKSIAFKFFRWIKKLNKHFKTKIPISYYKTLEAHKSGYPHIHALIYVPNHKFQFYQTSVYSAKEKRMVKVYRLKSDKVLNYFKKSWVHGIQTKFLGVPSRSHALQYISKYITKNTLLKKGNKNLLTLTLGWAFNQRSYTCSNIFRKTRKGKNFLLIYTAFFSQKNILIHTEYRNLLDEWEFVGAFYDTARDKLPAVNPFRRYNPEKVTFL